MSVVETSSQAVDQPDRPRDFGRFLVYLNPHSTNFKQGAALVDELQQSRFGSRVEVVPDYGDPESTQRAFVDQLGPNTIAMIGAGDGSRSCINDRMLHIPELRKIGVPILGLGLGDGNDSARTETHLASKRRPLSDIIESARITPIHPIKSTLTDIFEGSSRVRYGVAYMGIGMTAVGARLFDDIAHRTKPIYTQRQLRALSEFALAAKALQDIKSFPIQMSNEVIRRPAELTVANYSRMAKYGRFPIEADERMLFVSGIEHANLPETLMWFGRLGLGGIPGVPKIAGPQGSYLAAPTKDAEYSVQFTTLASYTPIHWDAEHDFLRRGTHVDIRSGDVPFYAVTTKL